MENDLLALLAADAAIALLVADRIYPAIYPQGVADPAIRYQKVAGSIGLYMQGSDGLSSDLVQVDIRAKSAQSALDVRAVVIAKLHSLSCVQGATDFRLIALRADRGVQFEKTDTASYFTALLEFDVYSRAAG